MERTREQIRAALEDLVKSDGWAIFMEHMATAWGPDACEKAMREAKAKAAPEEWPHEATRILDAFAAMRANVRWPEEMARTLKNNEPKEQTGFDRFRRFPRRSGQHL